MPKNKTKNRISAVEVLDNLLGLLKPENLDLKKIEEIENILILLK